MGATELPPSSESESDRELAEFGELWSRGEALAGALSSLPNELVLRSGLAARRSSLLSKWDILEAPGLDGLVPAGASDAVRGWNHEAELLISYLSTEVEDVRDQPIQDGRIRSVPITDLSALPQVIDSIAESDFITDAWCWPWAARPRPVAKKSKWDRGKMVKFGVLAGLGAFAAIAVLDEED